jgi:putative flippase GtrA/glycosyltransferase involved in cell wall biosynthesis
MTTQPDWPPSGQLVATLPLPAVVVPDFAGVRRVGERVAGQFSGPRAAVAPSRGRHAAPKQSMLPRVFDGSRFLLFSAIGGFVFLLGFGLQAWLTSGLHVNAVVSYLAQAVLSIEASFVLNRWLTWRDRDTALWQAFARFNAQKTVTVALNLALYGGLLWLGMNYLVANVVLTALFTVINFVAGDRFVFVPAGSKLAGRVKESPAPRFVAPPEPAPPRPTPPKAAPPLPGTCPLVSVVIPCRANEKTIGAAVRSLLDQDYPGLAQIILVGSPGDTTWEGLAGIADRRLVTLEIETPPGLRDANFKRNAGIRGATGDLISLVDSDIVLPPDWMSRAVSALVSSGANCVTGGMRSIHDTYWGRYTDSTRVGAKTPRIETSYLVTKANFGAGGCKPPITANTLFTPEMYAGCPIDATWSHGSYEDYEWFWRVASAGYSVLVSEDLFGWHHHRRGIRPLIKEYRRSSRGCAYFVRAHRDCPLSKRRLLQAIILPIAALVALAVAIGALASGYGWLLGTLALAGAAGIAADQVVQSRRLESVTYPVTGLVLGMVFTTGLITHLIKSRTAAVVAPEPRRPRWRAVPLGVICAIQAALSLSLIRSNTAFTDEADYLWVGRLLLAHWLHGTSWPAAYGERVLSGSPLIYPPLGALADSVGGLVGARLLSLCFMLCATVLLYLTATRLFGRTVAVFACVIWVLSEPVIRLAFATYDPLSIVLTALSAWLIVQASFRRRHGELVAAAAAALALANATAYSMVIIDPIVLAFACIIWWPRLGTRQATMSAAWFTGAVAIFFAALLTVSRSWIGIVYTIFARNLPDRQSYALVLVEMWSYTGLILVLAAIGAVIGLRTEARQRAGLIAVAGVAAFLVPVAQLYYHTDWSLDKHLAYGIWFASMAVGYGLSKTIRWVHTARRRLAVAFFAVAMTYPAIAGWQAASSAWQGWPNSAAFDAAFQPAAAGSHGLIFVAGQEHIAQYYARKIADWTRWDVDLPLDPDIATRTVTGYTRRLETARYGLVVLFYSTSFSAANLPGDILTSPQGKKFSGKLLNLVGADSEDPGLPALTVALEHDPAYRLIGTGPYNSAHNHAIFAIWKRVGASPGAQ